MPQLTLPPEPVFPGEQSVLCDPSDLKMFLVFRDGEQTTVAPSASARVVYTAMSPMAGAPWFHHTNCRQGREGYTGFGRASFRMRCLFPTSRHKGTEYMKVKGVSLSGLFLAPLSSSQQNTLPPWALHQQRNGRNCTTLSITSPALVISLSLLILSVFPHFPKMNEWLDSREFFLVLGNDC